MTAFASSLSIGLSALRSFERGLQVVGHNIANANTVGYSRQRVEFGAVPPPLLGGAPGGLGVEIHSVRRLGSLFTERALVQERRNRSGLETRDELLTRLESQFNDLAGSGLSEDLGRLFGALRDLSADPASLARRQAVLSGAERLAGRFHQQSAALSELRSEIDGRVAGLVPEINRLANEVAELNKQITLKQAAGESAADFVDRRAELAGQLAEKAGATIVERDDGQLRIHLTEGRALVDGASAFALRAVPDASDANRRHLYLEGSSDDLTPGLRAGQLGQLLDLRDQTVPGYQRQLDDLAAALIDRFNTAHRAGFDLSGAAGGDFFTPFVQPAPGDNTGAAAAIGLAASLRDAPERLAASGTGAPGDNGAALQLAALASQPLLAGGTRTFQEAYTDLVAGIGFDVQRTRDGILTSDAVFGQIGAQRQQISGVNLDEEAANLLTLQRGYEAASRFIRAADELLQDLMSQLR
jgi:flagellar hook-associated protein 1 FlgK